MKRAATLLVAALLLSCVPVAGARAAEGAVTLPFALVNNHVYVDVALDGKGPYRFVVDSGAPFNLLDAGLAARLGLAIRPRADIGGVGDVEQHAGTAWVREMRLGTIALGKQPFVVTALQETIGAAEGRRIDGVIGRDVLDRFVTTFDYAAGTLTLDADFDAAVSAGATVVPMRLRGGIPQIACAIDAVAGRCNVDTGSRLGVTEFAPFAGKHPRTLPPELTAVGVDGFGLGGPAYGRFGTLSSFSIGGFVLRDVVCDYSAQTRGAFADSQTAANVGGAIWRHFSLTLDYAHARLALSPSAGFALPDAFDRSGLFLTSRSGAIVVLDVRPGTPAAQAGLVKDDRILSLDGRPLPPEALPELREALAGEPGSVARLRVARSGIERDVVLGLRDYVPNPSALDERQGRTQTGSALR